jgi:hypothetical protein
MLQRGLVGQSNVIEMHVIRGPLRTAPLQCVQCHLKTRDGCEIIVNDACCRNWMLQNLGHFVDSRKTLSIKLEAPRVVAFLEVTGCARKVRQTIMWMHVLVPRHGSIDWVPKTVQKGGGLLQRFLRPELVTVHVSYSKPRKRRFFPTKHVQTPCFLSFAGPLITYHPQSPFDSFSAGLSDMHKKEAAIGNIFDSFGLVVGQQEKRSKCDQCRQESKYRPCRS